jgi:hypothetical protein
MKYSELQNRIIFYDVLFSSSSQPEENQLATAHKKPKGLRFTKGKEKRHLYRQ